MSPSPGWKFNGRKLRSCSTSKRKQISRQMRHYKSMDCFQRTAIVNINVPSSMHALRAASGVMVIISCVLMTCITQQQQHTYRIGCVVCAERACGFVAKIFQFYHFSLAFLCLFKAIPTVRRALTSRRVCVVRHESSWRCLLN